MQLLQRIEEVFLTHRGNEAVTRYHTTGPAFTLTYGELEIKAKELARTMLKHGMKPNDIVVCYMNKSAELVIAMLAAILNGGIACCLNHKLKPYYVLQLLAASKPRWAITEHAIYKNIKDAIPTVAGDTRVILYGKSIDVLDDTCLRRGDGVSLATSGHDMNNLAVCMFTSGSTGTPKGVLVSRDDLVRRSHTEVMDYGLSDTDRLLSLLPFSFDVGLNQLFSCMLAGAHLVILNSWFPRDILTTVESMGITGISGVPSVWLDLLSSTPKNDLPKAFRQLRYITVSGGDLPAGQLVQLREYFTSVSLYKTYGQTETFRSSILKPHDLDRKMTSVGRRVEGTEFFILNEMGEVAPPNEEGEIVHYGNGTMEGYLNDAAGTAGKLREAPSALKGVISRGKVVFTGDRGKMDEEGYLYVLGRKDGMIKSSGYRIYPREIENQILEHTGVKNAAVVGIADPLLGERIIAEVLPKGSLNSQELTSFLKHRLAYYMMPAEIHIVDRLPMTENGKVQYAEIRERHEERTVL